MTFFLVKLLVVQCLIFEGVQVQYTKLTSSEIFVKNRLDFFLDI